VRRRSSLRSLARSRNKAPVAVFPSRETVRRWAGGAGPGCILLCAAILCSAAPSPAEETQPAPSEAAAPSVPNVVPPKLLHFVDAEYPKEARAQGLSADVLLRLRVEADGSVSEADVVEPQGHGFDEAAVAAARQFVFEPARRDGKPIAVRIPFKYSFTLREQPVAEPSAPSRGDFQGRVVVAGSESPISGAQIVLRDPAGGTQSVTSDADGSWRVADLPGGTYHVEVQAPGFTTLTLDEELRPGEVTELTYRLSTDTGSAIEVSVYGDKPPREVTRRTITRREMTSVPGTSGDALRSVQNLPGLARAPGLAGLLIVRGSAPQDTAIFVNGDTVPLIYHFGGLSSAIPTELLDRIDFYPGNFSARYGRVTGGIVDVGLRSPDTSCRDAAAPGKQNGCFHGLAEVDLIDGRVLLQGPLPIDGWSFAIAGRRSWVDTWLGPVLEAAGAGVTSAPVYYDYQVIAERAPTHGTKISLRFFGSDDRLELLLENPSAQDPATLGGSLTFGTAFYRIEAVAESRLSRGVTLSSLLSFGLDKANFGLGRLHFDIDSHPFQAREEFTFHPAESLTFHAGLDFQLVPYTLLARLPEPPRPGEPDAGPVSTRPLLETREDTTFFRPAWYADAEWKIGRLTLTPGGRIDYSRDTGHADYSPRFSARYDLSVNATHADGSIERRTTLKAAAGVFYQPPQLQETDPVFGTPGLRSNRAIHYELGIERELNEHVELSLEGFYKDLGRLVSRAPGLDGAYAYGNQGTGSVIGLETLLKYKPDRRFFGWLAYTLSRSVRRDRPGAPEYLFQYDQTHILTVLGSYKLGAGWEVGARFRLVSGPLDTPALPFPSVSAVFAADAASYAPLQAAPYSERLPLVHQLDIRVEKKWHFDAFELTFFVDLWNAYNHPAEEALSYNFDYSRNSYQQGLPIIPSLGLRGEF
jgi:TonB family protein